MDQVSIVIEEFEARELQLDIIEPSDIESEDDDDILLSKCKYLSKLERLRKTKIATNMYLAELVSLYKTCAGTFSIEDNRRGRKSNYHPLECLVILLAYYKTGSTIDKFSLDTGYSPSVIHRILEKTRLILNTSLRKEWWENRSPLSRDVPDRVGLILDSTTIEVYRPKAKFEDSKTYWDGKNGIYGLKKEVAIQPYAPFYAMFTSKSFVASVHDFSIFKKNYKNYIPYLNDHEDVNVDENGDEHPVRYCVLADSAYIGADSLTPGIKRTCIRKHTTVPNLTLIQQELNQRRKVLRVHIECFFGRMFSSWTTFKNVYRFDHTNFDTDFDNCVLLTNCLIRMNALSHQEHTYYRGVVQHRKEVYQTRLDKEKAAQQRYRVTQIQRRNSQRQRNEMELNSSLEVESDIEN